MDRNGATLQHTFDVLHFEDTTSTPFDDSRVRQAFVMAVNREKLADEVYSGLNDPANGGFVPPGMPGHSPGIALPYNPEQARLLLVQAGYSDGKGFPKLHLAVASERVAVAEYLIAQWRDNLGVEVGIEIVELKEISGKTHSSNFDFRGWVADYPDPDNFLRVCLQGVMPHWQNETYESLLEDALRFTDQNERMQPYKAADKTLVEDAVIMPTTYTRIHRLVKPWIKVFGLSFNTYSLKDIIIEPH